MADFKASLMQKVKYVMENYPITRDSVDELVEKLQHLNYISEFPLVSTISQIVRYRALIEKNCPELRWTTYEFRQRKGWQCWKQIKALETMIVENWVAKKDYLKTSETWKYLWNTNIPNPDNALIRFFKRLWKR